MNQELQATLNFAVTEAIKRRHEYITLEHLLYALLHDNTASNVLWHCGAKIDELQREVDNFLNEETPTIGHDGEFFPEETNAFRRVLEYAVLQAEGSGQSDLNGGNILAALFQAANSHAVFFLKKQGVSRLDVLNYLAHGVSKVAYGAGPQRVGADGEPRREEPADPLAAYTTNLIERAAAGEIDPLIGRHAEIERTIQILCRRRKNNPLFVGDPGVGKTAIAEGLALRIHKKETPEVLHDGEVYALDMGALMAGTMYRGEFEARLKGVVKALLEKPNSILVIDEIHTIVGAGATGSGTLDASNIIKPALASGKMRCIGSTTYQEYKAAFERDKALARRFQKVEIPELSVAETVEVLNGLKSYYEEHHGITYTPEAINTAAELAGKFIHERFLPDKAIDVIDEAGAAVKLLAPDKRPTIIDVKDVEMVVARMAKIPPKSVASSEKDRLSKLDSELKAVIYGQDPAIEMVVNAIKLSRSGLGHPDHPVGSFLFTGPTGVGKTELAKQLAQVLGVNFLRFDMSEYMEPHTVSRLIGAPPGYVGFDQGGLLTDAINKTPHAVLVLDEIEKAHPNLFNILLQVMDHATLTDNNGKKADFRNVILIMTTNAGARELSESGIGFKGESGRGTGRGAIERAFSPEFRNRLDAIIPFSVLSPNVIERVVEKFIRELEWQLVEKKVTLELTDEARQWLAQKGYDKLHGARPMARLIQEKIKAPLADLILFGPLAEGGAAVIDVKDDTLAIECEVKEE
jgi:ATP-dependent Clp protease ATP-binding subunit ClpA